MNILTSTDWPLEQLPPLTWGAGQEHARLRDDLIARLQRLTGRPAPPERIWVDARARLATVRHNGALFRLHGKRLTIVRPCAECGVAALESSPIADKADLGYALEVWEPRCHHCPAADSPYWMEGASF